MSYSAIPLEPGEVVYRRGDDGETMYLVQEGAVEMLNGGEDGERGALFERGDFFGERAVLDQVVREHTLRATRKSRLILVDASGLAHMLLRNPEIAVRMIRKLAGRLHSIEQQLALRLADGATDDATLAATASRGRLIFSGDGTGEPIAFVLDGEMITIGRTDPLSGIAPDIDLTALDPQLTTSRRHAFFERQGSSFVIAEVRATNGTFVNGRRLRPEIPVRLVGGEEVVFGGVVMHFEIGA